MKRSVFFATLALAALTYKASDAQVSLHVGFNFGGAPVYAPVPPPAPVEDVQYSDEDDYYYLPDADAYYCVPEHEYYYMDDNRWVSAPHLPGRFRDVDWRYVNHYEIREPRPFMHHDMYRTRFNGFAGGNPNWRSHDNRFNGGGFAPNRGDFGGDREGYAHREFNGPDYNRPNPQGGQFNGRGWGNRGGGYNGPMGQMPNNGYGQNNRNVNNNGGGQQMSNGYNPQGQSNQFNGSQGGNQNHGQYNRPSNDQNGRNSGGSNMQQHFVSNNGPGYTRQNGMYR